MPETKGDPLFKIQHGTLQSLLEITAEGKVYLRGRAVGYDPQLAEGLRAYMKEQNDRQLAQANKREALWEMLFKLVDLPNMDGEFAEYLDENDDIRALFDQAAAVLG